MQPSPTSPKVIVPDPPHAALVTVITISPPSATIMNVLINPLVPAASVPVSAAAVEKYVAVTAKFTAPPLAKSSLPLNKTLPPVARFPPVIFPFALNVSEMLIELGRLTVIVPAAVIGDPDTVKVELVNATLVTVPDSPEVEIVTLPLLPLTEIPVPADILVTPVLTIVILPLVVTGLPVTCIPVPGVTPTLVTVPTDAALDIEVTRPYASTVTVGYVYVPADTPVVVKSIVNVPLETIGFVVLLVTAILAFDEPPTNPTLVTVPLPLPFPPPPTNVITIFPVFPLSTTPLFAVVVMLVTPVFNMSTTPVFAFAVTVIPVLELNVL